MNPQIDIFKTEEETKRVIFNVRMDLAERLDQAKEDAKTVGRKLDLEGVINEALEKFLRKAEKRLADMLADREEFKSMRITPGDALDEDAEGQARPESGPEAIATPEVIAKTPRAPAPSKPSSTKTVTGKPASKKAAGKKSAGRRSAR